MPAIRQQISIAASPRSVWGALTTPEGLTQWWVDEARVDARVGGRLVLHSTDDEGEPLEERGIFLDYTPTRRIEIAFDAIGQAPQVSRVQFQIARAGGETRLSVVLSGGASLEDEETFTSLTRDWKSSLKALRAALEAE